MMDICRPPVQWIDGRCYRRQEEVEYKVEAGYTGEEYDEVGEEEELQHEIVELQGGRYRAALQIAEPFYGFIIGKGGEGKRRLEAETKTKVQVPKKGQQGEVIVEGRSRSGVAAAASRFCICKVFHCCYLNFWTGWTSLLPQHEFANLSPTSSPSPSTLPLCKRRSSSSRRRYCGTSPTAGGCTSPCSRTPPCSTSPLALWPCWMTERDNSQRTFQKIALTLCSGF